MIREPKVFSRDTQNNYSVSEKLNVLRTVQHRLQLSVDNMLDYQQLMKQIQIKPLCQLQNLTS